MPTEVFNKINKEKKERVLLAIKEELKINNVGNFNVAHVVKGAGIPRGSFYQYFTDKEDAIEYTIKEMTMENLNTDIDEEYILDYWEKTIIKEYENFSKNEYRKIFINLFMSNNKIMKKCFNNDKPQKILNKEKKYLEMIKDNNLENAESLKEILMALEKSIIAESLKENYSIDKVKSKLKLFRKIIEGGIK